MGQLVTFPREVTAARVLPHRDTIYAEARKVALSAGADWPRVLGAAATLSHSPDWTDMQLARHIYQAHSLHLAGLLRPVNPRHRDRSDMVDGWREAVLEPEPETSAQVAARHWPQVAAMGLGVALAVLAVALTGGGW